MRIITELHSTFLAAGAALLVFTGCQTRTIWRTESQRWDGRPMVGQYRWEGGRRVWEWREVTPSELASGAVHQSQEQR